MQYTLHVHAHVGSNCSHLVSLPQPLRDETRGTLKRWKVCRTQMIRAALRREREKKGEKERGRKGGSEGGREGDREGGREGDREGEEGKKEGGGKRRVEVNPIHTGCAP